MPSLFIGVTNAYPSSARPYDLIFVHRWIKQIEPYFNKVLVITRIKGNKFTSSIPLIGKDNKAKTIVYDLYDGIQVCRIRTYNILPENYLPFNGLFTYKRIRKLLTYMMKDYSEVVVQLATWGDFSFVSAIILKQMGVQYFASAIGNYENKYYNKRWNVNNWVLKYIYNNSRFVLCVSKDLETKVKSISDKIETFVFYSGVDLKVFRKLIIGKEELIQKWQLENNGFYFVFVGRICKQKGILELLDSFARFKDRRKKIHLLLVGQLKDKIIGQKIENTKNCKWIPPVNEVKINELLNIADAFIFPSWSEGTPNSLLEAMAVGLPIITTRVGGITDVIMPGYNGVLINPKSNDELASSITLIYENECLRKELGKNAQLTIRKRFDYDQNGMALINKLNIDGKA